MLNFLCGEIVDIADGQIVLKCGNIGYELFVSNSTISALGGVGNTVQLFVHLQVKEDGLTLYGFSDAAEKQMFLRLIGVSGIGCKMAMSILTNCDIRQFALAVLTGDAHALSSIKGVGKKTAERIVLELKEKVTDEEAKGGLHITLRTPEDEAVTVLMSLGLTRGEALNRIRLAKESGGNTSEEILNLALKNKW